MKIPTQFIKKKTLKKGNLAIAGKIALQMNAKIGGIPW